MKKEDKAIIIEKLGEQIKEYAHFYLVDVTGMNAEATSALRRKAFEASDVDYSALYGCLKGTTAVFFCDTANVPAKLIKETGKEGVPTLKGAYAEEGFYVGADQLETLCAIKSKNEVIAEVVALLQSPAKNVISALSGAGQTIHGVLKTLGERPE